MSKQQEKKTELLQIFWEIESLRENCRDRIETIRDIISKSNSNILNPLTTEEKMVLEELRAQLEDVKETNFIDIDRLDSVFMSLKSICGDTDEIRNIYDKDIITSDYYDDNEILF